MLILSRFSILSLFFILLIIPNFLKIDKVIVSNWYQNLEDKLIREWLRFKINKLSCSEKTLFKKTQIDRKHIDIKKKYKEEIEGVNELKLIAKVNFLNQAKWFMPESYISQLHGNAHDKTRKWRYFI